MADWVSKFKRVFEPEECVGKTVEAVHGDDDRLGFRFADPTYLVLKADNSWGDGPELSHREEIPADFALALGLIDRAEWDRVEGVKAAKEEARRKAQRLAQYERLRKEFEPDEVQRLIRVLDDHKPETADG